jgi:hypothetical protein
MELVMRVKWVLGLVLLGCSIGLPARQAVAQAEGGQTHDSEANRVTAEGCLQRYGWQYFLNERDGTQEQLTGYPKLKDLVGHDIEISGVRGVKTVDATPPGGGSSVVMHPVINVKTVKDLGKGCAATN